MDVEDAEPSLHRPIDNEAREILGYLHTLGVNIQKRTQYLLDSKVNAQYLRSNKNLDKLVEKVDTICTLSVTSLEKVNRGLKLIINKEKKHRKDFESKEKSIQSDDKLSSTASEAGGSGQEVLTGVVKTTGAPTASKEDNKSSHKSEKIKPKPVEDKTSDCHGYKDLEKTLKKTDLENNKVDQQRVQNLYRKKVTVNDLVFYLTERIHLQQFLNCSVRINHEDRIPQHYNLMDFHFTEDFNDSIMDMTQDEKHMSSSRVSEDGKTIHDKEKSRTGKKRATEYKKLIVHEKSNSGDKIQSCSGKEKFFEAMDEGSVPFQESLSESRISGQDVEQVSSCIGVSSENRKTNHDKEKSRTGKKRATEYRKPPVEEKSSRNDQIKSLCEKMESFEGQEKDSRDTTEDQESLPKSRILDQDDGEISKSKKSTHDKEKSRTGKKRASEYKKVPPVDEKSSSRNECISELKEKKLFEAMEENSRDGNKLQENLSEKDDRLFSCRSMSENKKSSHHKDKSNRERRRSEHDRENSKTGRKRASQHKRISSGDEKAIQAEKKALKENSRDALDENKTSQSQCSQKDDLTSSYGEKKRSDCKKSLSDDESSSDKTKSHREKKQSSEHKRSSKSPGDIKSSDKIKSHSEKQQLSEHKKSSHDDKLSRKKSRRRISSSESEEEILKKAKKKFDDGSSKCKKLLDDSDDNEKQKSGSDCTDSCEREKSVNVLNCETNKNVEDVSQGLCADFNKSDSSTKTLEEPNSLINVENSTCDKTKTESICKLKLVDKVLDTEDCPDNVEDGKADDKNLSQDEASIFSDNESGLGVVLAMCNKIIAEANSVSKNDVSEIAENDPVSNNDVASEIAENDPVSNNDVASEIAENYPVSNNDVASEIAENDPVSNNDVASEIAENDPVSNNDVASEIAENDPVSNNDVASEVAETDSVLDKDVASEIAQSNDNITFENVAGTESSGLDSNNIVTSKSSNKEKSNCETETCEGGVSNVENSTDETERNISQSPPFYPSDNEDFDSELNQNENINDDEKSLDNVSDKIDENSSDSVSKNKKIKTDVGAGKCIDGIDGLNDGDSANVSENDKTVTKEDEGKTDISDSENSAVNKVPLIRCVNINNLLSSNFKNDVLSVNNVQKQTPKKTKNVTFLETPIHIKNSIVLKNSLKLSKASVSPKSPTSILLNKKSSYSNCWNSSVIELSDDSESEVSSTTRELLKNIKNSILEGKSDCFVKMYRDLFYSTHYANYLTEYKVKRIYDECGKLRYSEKQKKLNEEAKKSVLSSSSADDENSSQDGLKQKQQALKSKTTRSSDSDCESSDFEVKSYIKKKKTKKFAKKRPRSNNYDSDDPDIRNLLRFPKSKRKKQDSSDNSNREKKSKDSSSDGSDNEMGRSARLKQREAPTAFTKSNIDRNGSDSSISSSSKTEKAGSSKKIGKKSNVLLDIMTNGNANKSASDTDQSNSDKTDSVPNTTSTKPEKEKPLSDTIKKDLLDDESSSSALDTTPKINGKGGKKTKKEPVEIVKSEDSDEDKVETIESDSDDVQTKRPSSTINLDTESDDSIKTTKTKIKKCNVNGTKKGDRDVEEGKRDRNRSDTDSSEIFVPTKRKRKAKKKASSSHSDEENSQDSDSKEAKKKRKRIKKVSGDESSGNEGSDSEEDTKHKGRKNIRALKKSSHLDSATREAAKKERERVARIAERQRLYNESMFDESGRPEEIAKLDKVVLDFDPETKEPLIIVDRGLVQKLKPHQANGIKFMWNACFESVNQINDSKGSGCILAHCMGLGKTLQVITLVHTLLAHRDKTQVERVLVVCPLSTVLNWVNEFKMWLEFAETEEEINIFELSRYKQNHERSYQLKEWLECGGVCILGYDMFRNLSADNPKKFRKAQLNSFQKALVDPGPDLVVCDEGHLLKNEKTSLSQSMNKIKSLRRIVLTGTPLQNNLKEYYCMVQFVKPNLLGKYNEYLNRFVNPITNGQYTNSTDYDIKVMKRRSHVLHKMLDGAVQRRDYAVLAPFLPPKHEYVLFLALTEIQVKLYRHYLENYSRRPNPDKKTTPSLFADFQSLQRIWTHPLVLKANSERYELMLQKKRDKEEEEDTEGSLADFIDDEEDTTTSEDTSSSESDDSDDSDRPKKKKKNKNSKSTKTSKRVTRAAAVSGVNEEEDDDVQEVKIEEPKMENPTEWWMSLCSEEELNDIRHSNKVLLLLDILKECEAIGDKLLVFSQSLYSLDLIEQFLAKIDEATQKGSKDDHLGGHSGSWSQGLDYFRLDGSTSCENRSIWCKAFNREDNPRARLFLISTRAGGLGINLVAANRVVIFDISWNPSHDVQSIFRVYRFGQKKPCYIYRFLALGTMEEKIYERQVTKQAISKRVIDEQQIDRHYNESDLAELYMFNPEPEGSREVPLLPKDRLFADLLKQHDTVIYKYHEHDSLLENKEEETLTEEERKAAWEDYENEKTRPPSTMTGTNWLLMQQQQQQHQMTINALQAVLRQDYPAFTDQQIMSMIPAILQQMHTNGDAALTQKLTAMMAAQNNMMGGQMPGFKGYNSNMMAQGMMMNPGGVNMAMRSPMYQQAWQQQQQQLQMQRLQQQQAMQANMKYYAGGLGSRDLMDMAALQQQQRALLLGNTLPSTRGRPPKTVNRPLRPVTTSEVVDLDSE